MSDQFDLDHYRCRCGLLPDPSGPPDCDVCGVFTGFADLLTAWERQELQRAWELERFRVEVSALGQLILDGLRIEKLVHWLSVRLDKKEKR